MKTFLRSIAAVIALSVGLQVQAGPAFTVTTPGLLYPGTQYTLGFEFSVVSAETIQALGVFDDGQNGLSVAAHVGLWDTAGNLLASVVVPAGTGGTLIGDFRYAAISPFFLTPGTHYIVGSYLPIDNATSLFTGQGGTGFVDPNVTVVEDRFSNFDSAFSFPDSTNSHPGGAWLGANFTSGAVAVPEPTTLALLSLGVAGLAAFRRRKQ